MQRFAYEDYVSCTIQCVLPDWATHIYGLVRTFTIGTFRRQILALFGGALPDQVLLGAESTVKLWIWTLSVYMPVLLALFAHLAPALLIIGPIGEAPGLPNSALLDCVVSHN
jgi:hypothetical protein